MDRTKSPIDVLVIGAGASGGPFTWSLSESGINVMCLEQGNWIDPKTYPTTQRDWELHRYTDFNADPNVRGLPEDYPVNNTNSPIAPLMYNAVGGSAIHWSAHFPRFHPSDFYVRTLDGVGDDWPLDYQKLEPFFDLNDKMMGVSGIQGDPAYPPKPARQTPPVPIGKLGNTIAAGFEKLSWHWWPSDGAIITKPYDGRAPCNNCGPCDLGCFTRAKASPDVTYWPRALDNGAFLETGTRVREITIGKDGLTNGAIYYDQNGNVHHQKARMVVLACNGVGTPRLLLNSKSPLFPDGLANNNGVVGKNLMFHPVSTITGIFDDPLEGHKGPVGNIIFSHEFYETNLSRGFVRGYGLQVVRSFGPVHTAAGGIGGHRVPWGKNHHQVFTEQFGHTAVVGVMAEDLPESHNRVTLDPNMADGDGIPAPRISYTLSENSRKILSHGIDRGTELMQASGAKDVSVNPLLSNAGWHLLGTARMGTNENNSVVDGLGRCHDVNNLYIIDGSIFTTSGAVNPTSTIQALALFIANHIKTNSRHLLG